MATRRGKSIGLFVSIAVVFAVSAWLQFGVHLNHDVAWVLHSAGWLIEGKTFGEDIVVANPPLIWYLSVPPAFASRWLNGREVATFRVYVYLVSALLLWLSWASLRPLRAQGQGTTAAAVLITIAYCALIRVGRDFGQREPLAMIMVLPYLFVVAGRLFRQTPPTWLAVTSGILAGLGFALKPYFLLSPLVVEAVFASRGHSFRHLFRLESLSLGAAVAIYGASIFVATPEYAFTVVPLVRSVFWAFEADKSAVAFGLLPYAGMFLLALALLPLSPRTIRPYFIFLTAGGSGFIAGYLIQSKGYSYHLFPVLLLATMLAVLVITAAFQMASRLPVRWQTTVLAYRGGLLALLIVIFGMQVGHVAGWYAFANRKNGPFGVQTERLIGVANRYASGESIYAFSTHPYPGFPVVAHSRARWGSRMNSQFVIPAVVRARESGGRDGTGGLENAVAFQRRAVLEDFRKHQPAVVFVDNRDVRHAIGNAHFDFIEFFTADRAFAAVWESYKEIESIDGFRVFIRSDISSKTEIIP